MKAKNFLLVEAVVCFAPAGLLLWMGLLMVPTQIWFLFNRGAEDDTTGPFILIAWVTAGVAGVIALANLLCWILNPSSNFIGRYWTLAGAAVGSAALLPYAIGPVDSAWWRLVAWLPLLCAGHLIYLGRRFLFHHSTRDDGSA